MQYLIFLFIKNNHICIGFSKKNNLFSNISLFWTDYRYPFCLNWFKHFVKNAYKIKHKNQSQYRLYSSGNGKGIASDFQ